MKRALYSALILAFASLTAAETRRWNDILRDVYAGPKLDRSIQTLSTTKPRMLALLPEGTAAYIVDLTSCAVTKVGKDAFTFAEDRNSATTAAELKGEPAGVAVMPNDQSIVIDTGDETFVIGSHQSRAGAMTVEDIWTTAPVWKSIRDHYDPIAEAVARLRDLEEPTQVEIVLATWCGDSKFQVPRLLKAIDDSGNANIKVHVIGVGPLFHSPMEYIERERITNVPTIIVKRGDREIGRIVETPAAATIEEDLADILQGSLKTHPGRWERGAAMSSGTYEWRDARGRRMAAETFTLYQGAKDGHVVHSVSTLVSGDVIEVWAGIDGSKKPSFTEVTYSKAGKHATRARYRVSDGEWVVVSRGDESGVLDQRVALPEKFAVVTPATATFSWVAFDECDAAYVVPRAVSNGLGRLESIDARTTGTRTLRVGAEKKVCDVVNVSTSRESYRLAIDSVSKLPVRIDFADGSSRALVRLQAVASKPPVASAAALPRHRWDIR